MASGTNPSFILESKGVVKYEDRPVPKLASPNDVIINIKQTGICGSDVHYWVAGAIGSFVVRDPMVLGHESSGIVSEVGSAVTTLKVGDRVALEPGVPCRRCVRCKEGQYNLCAEMAFAATPPFDGTLTKYYALPEDFCYKLPEHVSLEEGALVEPLSVAVHLVKQSGVKPGQSIVVMGAGPVGLLCCAVAKAHGATAIISVDIVPERLEFAQKFAATGTFTPQRVPAEENAKALREQHGFPDGVDVVIDASGAEPSIQTSIHVLRVGGTHVQGGMGKPEITFPITALCVKEINCRGSFRYSSGDYKLAVELVASGKIDVKQLITRKVSFKEAEQAFEDVKAGKGIKILIGGVED
ncbi:MAG: hypothetical protein M1825_000596 [Sarcosagium campestre]|nr:MAG: hypothetical protein M1825_000596 [Sarcosagium campestre]